MDEEQTGDRTTGWINVTREEDFFTEVALAVLRGRIGLDYASTPKQVIDGVIEIASALVRRRRESVK